MSLLHPVILHESVSEKFLLKNQLINIESSLNQKCFSGNTERQSLFTPLTRPSWNRREEEEKNRNHLRSVAWVERFHAHITDSAFICGWVEGRWVEIGGVGGCSKQSHVSSNTCRMVVAAASNMSHLLCSSPSKRRSAECFRLTAVSLHKLQWF